MPNGTVVGPNVGSSSYPVSASGSFNFQRNYYRHHGASGDVRAHYEDLEFTSTGSGEVLRLRGIANGTGVATGGTVNAAHFTGRVASGKTVSGALNAVRATLEVAGTTPTPGGTLAALQVDVNASASTTFGANTSFIRFTNSGSTAIENLFNIEYAPATTDPTKLVTTHADTVSSHLIKIRVNGADMWLLATSTHT